MGNECTFIFGCICIKEHRKHTEELVKWLLCGVENGMDGVMVGKRTLDFSMGTFYIILSFEAH